MITHIFSKNERSLFTLIIIPVVAFVLLFASLNVVQAGTSKNWELVYDQNSDGSVISGSLSDLISAIRSGADVQLIIHEPTTEALIKPDRVRIDSNATLVKASISESYPDATGTNVVKRFTVFKTTPSVESSWEQNSGYANDNRAIAISWYVSR